MQYDETKTEPESTLKYLVQQVEEQSVLCDVIVKHGLWEKKFHRCVLAASPFIDNVLKTDFLEKQTGKIEIKLGTPTTLEMAIQFLYGSRPKLAQDNVEHLLYLSEFLLIPNLKSACIRWIDTVDIVSGNCVHFLQLSSIFDFEFPECTEYIEGHLSELLILPEMVSLTFDSVNVLYSDRRLSYVSMDDKLRFLLKWKDCRHDQNNEEHFKELLRTINFNEVSVSYLQDLQDNQMFIDGIDLEQKIRDMNDSPDKHRVLVMKADREDGTFWCFDLERTKWYRLDSRVLKESCYDFEAELHGNHDSEIYFTTASYGSQYRRRKNNILVVNLQSDSRRKIKLVLKNSENDFQTLCNLKLNDDLCVLNVNQRNETKMLSKIKKSSIELPKMKNKEDTSVKTLTIASTLYKGVIADEVLQMSPLLTFKYDIITRMCIGNNLTVAMLFNLKKCISLYDLAENTMERIDICTELGDKLSPTEDGFVVYNNKRCLCLKRQTGPSLSTKYVLKEISFICERLESSKYFLFGQMWYHYYRKKYENFKLESAPYQSVITQPTTKNIDWKPLPLPIEEFSCHEYTINDNCFEICLPKSILRCDIECPHCKAATRQSHSPTFYHHDSDDTSVEELLDDDYYGYGSDEHDYIIDLDESYVF